MLGLALLAAAPADAATYHVTSTGSDGNPCTASAPCRSIERGVSKLKSGDTLLVGDGEYTARWPYKQPAAGASWSSPTRIKAAPGARPIIKAVPGQHAVTFVGTHHVVLDGFVIDAAGGIDGIKSTWGSGGAKQAKNIGLYSLEIKNASGQGILAEATDGLRVIDCDIHHNGTTDHDHGIYASGVGGLVDGNRIWENAGWGVHLYSGRGNVKIANWRVIGNSIHHNAAAGARGWGIIAGGSDNEIAHNDVWQNQGGIAIQYTGAERADVHHNYLDDNNRHSPYYGIWVDGPDSTVHENEVWGHGPLWLSGSVPVEHWGNLVDGHAAD